MHKQTLSSIYKFHVKDVYFQNTKAFEKAYDNSKIAMQISCKYSFLFTFAQTTLKQMQEKSTKNISNKVRTGS